MLFSLDTLSGEAYISLYAAGQMLHLGRLRRIETLTIVKEDGYEGLALNFVGAQFDPARLQTKPVIRVTCDVLPAGTW